MNLKAISIYTLLILSVMLSACDRILIEPDTTSEPVRNFEIFWNDVNKTYPFFTEDNVDWQAIHDKYRPYVYSKTTNEELFSIFIEMMKPLMDGHRSLYYKSPKYGEIGWSNPNDYPDNYSFSLVRDTYLKGNITYLTAPDYFEPFKIDTIGYYGLADNGNYIYFRANTFLTEYNYVEKLSQLVQQYGTDKPLILDLRYNGGGSLYTMLQLMNYFTNFDLEYAYYKPRVGPSRDDLIPERYEQYFGISPSKYGYFPNKVCLLTNRHCYSATEHATLIGRSLGNIYVVGDTTGGALSPIIDRTLPNGIQYVLVNAQVKDVNGILWERKGVPPEYPVATSSSDFVTSDPYIEKSFEILAQ